MTPDTDGFIDSWKAIFWCAVFVTIVTLGIWLGME